MSTTNSVSNIPVSVDYTSRDYYSLRAELITLIQDRVNRGTGKVWTATDPTDFGVAMVEAFAYMGDIVNYYIDRIANEAYLPTASQRQNILNIAGTYGYVPVGYRASETTMTFYSLRTEEVTLPVGTVLSVSVVCDDVIQDLLFTLTEEVVLDASDGTTPTEATGTISHGQNVSVTSDYPAFPSELLGSSDGTANQTYVLSENQVVDGTVKVYVSTSDVFEPWVEVTHLTDYGPNDPVYSTKLDADNFVSVIFGDGVSGAIPSTDAAIRATYVVGGGTIGNIGAIPTDVDRWSIHYIQGLTNTQVSLLNRDLNMVTLEGALGGDGPEDDYTIRKNAPKVLTAAGRAVSLKDYEVLALSAPSVGKAKATAETANSVTIYVAPTQEVGSSDSYPGFNSTNTSVNNSWLDTQEAAVAALEDSVQIGVSVTVSPPTYTLVSTKILYTTMDKYDAATVLANIKQSLITQFSYSFLDFAYVLRPEDIEFVLRQVDGVRAVRVVELYRTDDDVASKSTLVGSADEIFVFVEANVEVYESSSNVATLSNIALNHGTLSPTFASGTKTYTVTGYTDASIVITPTTTVPDATFTVNGVSATTPITIPVGTTIIPVIVTAGDGTTVSVYTVSVTKP